MQILQTLNVPFESVNILEDEQLRSGMKEFSQWPTFPQVYINGEFYGGCDIMIGMQPHPPLCPRCSASAADNPASVAIPHLTGLATLACKGPQQAMSSVCEALIVDTAVD